MKFYLLNLLFLSLFSFSSQAGSYSDSSDFNIEISIADDIEIVFDNDGVVIFEDLEENDVIDAVSSYEINASLSRAFSCSIEINGVYQNVGVPFNTYLKNSSGSNTTHVITMNYLGCDNGVNNVVISGVVGGDLDSNDTYYIDTQYIGVSYVPGIITSFT